MNAIFALFLMIIWANAFSDIKFKKKSIVGNYVSVKINDLYKTIKFSYVA